MWIPSEVIPPVANRRKGLEDDRKAEPVGSSARLENDLSASPRRQAAPSGHEGARPQQATSTPVAPQLEAPQARVERRQTERRSENRPVLLDTRSKTARRQASAKGRIDIKV